MKTLLDCDAVFDRLTRAPFPEPRSIDDQAVLEHVAVCHECRSLAEALRPAVKLFSHEQLACDGEDPSLPAFTAEVGLAGASRMRSPLSNRSSGRSLATGLAGALLAVMLAVAVYSGRNGNRHGLALTGGDNHYFARSLLALAPLNLSSSCLATRTADDDKLRLLCCTDCHATAARNHVAVDFQRLQKACVACHGQ